MAPLKFLSLCTDWIPTAIYAAVRRVGRKEFVNGEFNAAEKLARIIVTAAHAFLFGHAIIICRNKKLRIAFKADYTELTQGNIYAASIIAGIKRTGKCFTYKVRQRILVDIAGRAIACIYKLEIKYDGVNSLYYSYGTVGALKDAGSSVG